MPSILFRGGRIRAVADDSQPHWMVVEGENIAAVGDGEPPRTDRVVNLGGGTLIPGFCDAHVHLPATGLQAAGMDFRSEKSAATIMRAFSDRAASKAGILYGGNFEDPLDTPLTRRDLDRAVGDQPALLSRADMHSCVVSSALLDKLDISQLEGVDRDSDGPTGYLREQAASEAWRWFDANLSPDEQRTAVRTAVDLAYSKGITRVHEMFVVEWRGWASLEVFVDCIEGIALDVTPYVGTDDVARVKEIGLPRIGGDYFLDGSFGSHTAWLGEPYDAPPPSGSGVFGIGYRDDDHLLEFFMAAQEAGLQTGVHAIGDAAIEQAIRTWEAVADKVGLDAVRVMGHRIEHFECASDDHIRRAARLGLGASVQPAFDRFWGGESGLYAERIGWDRARLMNRFRSMLDAGLILGAGSDSTVTPLDPFLQMAALREHHVEEERIGPRVALMLHTFGGHALMHGVSPSTRGSIEVGKRADLAWLDRDPIESSTDEMLDTEVLGTWIAGQRVWPTAEAEVA
ncbi:MAG: amidohydrolase [Actinomycetota bacterium]